MSEIIDRLNAALEGRYAVERELGEGGMATVFLAEDLKHKRKVAVKVLKSELAAVVGAERFLAEIEVTANLQHPHILPLFDSGEADGFLFYVMPYVEGDTLKDQLDREKQLPVDEAVRITTAVAGALDHAHRHGVIHRDIKPANILLQDGQPVVADFGIALAVGAAGGARLTETGLSIGTPYYMSPEQATGDAVVGPQSDTYALACVTYQMLVGDPPYVGSTAQAVLGKIIAGKAVPPSEHRPAVPPNVDAAVQKALEKLPADRFKGTQDFAKALADPAFRHGSGEGTVGAGAAGGWNRLNTLLAAAVVALLGVSGWALIRPARSPGVLRYSIRVPIELGLVNDIGTNMDVSESGTMLVYAGAAEGLPQLWVRPRDQLEPRALDGTDDAHQPFFSPDGDRIGFITQTRQLKVVSLRGEPPLTVVDSGVVRAGGDWGGDGYIYFSEGTSTGNPTGGLGRVPATGGPIESVTSLDTAASEVAHLYPDVLPGSRGVLFTVATERLYDPETQRIAVADLESGEHEVLLEGIMARWSDTGHILVVRADGALLAAPFDDRSLELEGPATPLLEGVQVEGLASADLVISRTGTLVYAPGEIVENPDQIVWVGREGAAIEVDPGWTGTFRYPRLSPEGGRLVLSIDRDGEEQLWVKQLDQGPLSKLTFEGALNYRGGWSPDGTTVAFVSDRSGPDRDLYARRADGSSPPELILDLDDVLNEVLYSPDGEWLVYRREEDLFARRVSGDTVVVPLATSSFRESQPALAPDGRWIAFTSNESGRSEVYVHPFPNTGDARWQVSTNGGQEPVWGPRGREIFYRSLTGQMMSVEVLEGTTFIMGQERILFSAQGFRGSFTHRMYDVAPDGQRFVMIRRASTSEEGELIVVENFFEELLDRVRN